MRALKAACSAAGISALLFGTPAAAQIRTLQDALVAAYSTNPQLLASRAQLRATDEGVPQALAGWRPTVTVSGSVGYADGSYRTTSRSLAGNTVSNLRNNRDTFQAAATATQPLYRGGATRSTTNQADNRVFGQRGRLMAAEQQVFTDTVTAFVNVILSQQVLQLQTNNEQVLTRQLQATNDRFRVGEITRTDVAQAEAALAGAVSVRTNAQGQLATARAAFQRTVGELPQNLTEPQPIALPVKTEAEAVQLASQNNPNVVAALFDDSAAKDAIDVAFSALMPQVSAQAQAFRNDNTALAGQRTIGGQVLLNASVPLYQGGAEYSRVRQARQTEQQARKSLDDARRAAIQQALQQWETLQSVRATIESTRVQIRANQVALEGVQREAIVGSRTTLDVLNAEQTLLNSRVTLVQNLAQLVTASYSVAAAIGRLSARDLSLPVPLYDETAYYNAVRGKLFGVSDYATDQPNR